MVDLDAGEVFHIIGKEVDIILKGMGLQAHVIAGPVGVGDRLKDPVDTDPDQMQQFPQHHRHLGGVDTVGTED